MRLIIEQFTSDLLSVVALSVRFYILLFRINVYDMLDDCFDSYYIFVGDFAENTYTGETLVRITSETVSSLPDNQSDVGFTNDTFGDTGRDLYLNLAVAYFKVMSWLIFLLELALRLTLAVYVCYLVLIEVHGVNRSVQEDTYFSGKRASN